MSRLTDFQDEVTNESPVLKVGSGLDGSLEDEEWLELILRHREDRTYEAGTPVVRMRKILDGDSENYRNFYGVSNGGAGTRNDYNHGVMFNEHFLTLEEAITEAEEYIKSRR